MERRTSRKVREHRAVISVVAAVNAIAALAGAAGLAFGFVPLDPLATSRLPLDSTVLGGLALALLVGLPNAFLMVLAMRGSPLTGPMSIVLGAVLVLWIFLELAFIRELSFFHPFYIAVGLFQMWLGADAVKRTNGLQPRWHLRGPRSLESPTSRVVISRESRP